MFTRTKSHQGCGLVGEHSPFRPKVESTAVTIPHVEYEPRALCDCTVQSLYDSVSL